MMNEKELIDFLVNDKSSLSQEEQIIQIITANSQDSITDIIEKKRIEEIFKKSRAGDAPARKYEVW